MRGIGRARLLIGVVVLLTLVPQAGIGAPSKTIRPPYLDAQTYAYCYDTFGLESCSSTVAADKVTGAIGLSLTATSSLDGTGVGISYADGSGDVFATFSLRRAVSRVAVTITMQINSAEATSSSVLGGGNAYIYAFSEVAQLGSCDAGCSFGWGYAPIVDNYSDQDSVQNQTVILSATLDPAYGHGTVDPGTYAVRAGFYGYASQFVDTGSTTASVDAVVVRMTVG